MSLTDGASPVWDASLQVREAIMGGNICSALEGIDRIDPGVSQ